LKLTLNAYVEQTLLDHIKEIIIVDDGSTDDTRFVINDFCEKFPIQILYFYQENKGPAEARNKGICAASGDILLITGDDIVPDSQMVAEHYLTHKKYDFNSNISCLGKTIWPTDKKITPFMEYIQEMGLQFGYSLITDENNVLFNFFYTSNISVQRNFLLKGKLFDTEFPYAVWEDIELGYRLKMRGLQIVYNKNAIGYHHHNIYFDSFRKRQELCGYSAHIFYNKHPELRDFLAINSSNYQNPMVHLTVKLAEKFCLFAEKYLPMSFPSFYDLVMGYYYNKGVVNYMSDRSKKLEHSN
jgi:glycosyltransferase involved in cell wall biosynthesis